MILLDAKRHIFHSSLLDKTGIDAGFGTKKFSSLKLKNPATVNQVHSTCIENVNNGFKSWSTADGLVTRLRQITLIVRTADCVPIIYVARNCSLIGISHQGWRGTLEEMPQKMVNQFYDQGILPKDIIAAIGPSIGACCYDVHEDRAKCFLQEFDKKVVVNRGGKFYLDLKRANFDLLVKSGIPELQIDFFPFCTQCNERFFWSFRRSKTKNSTINYVRLSD